MAVIELDMPPDVFVKGKMCRYSCGGLTHALTQAIV
jgi:hypothetical protein